MGITNYVCSKFHVPKMLTKKLQVLYDMKNHMELIYLVTILKKIFILKIEIKITIGYLIVNFTYFVNLLCFDMLFL